MKVFLEIGLRKARGDDCLVLQEALENAYSEFDSATKPCPKCKAGSCNGRVQETDLSKFIPGQSKELQSCLKNEECDIILDEGARFTVMNFTQTLPAIRDNTEENDCDAFIVTSDYHVPRSQAIISEFQKLSGVPTFEVIGAKRTRDTTEIDTWLMKEPTPADKDAIERAMGMEEAKAFDEYLATCDVAKEIKKNFKNTILEKIILDTPRDMSNAKCMVLMIKDYLAGKCWADILIPENPSWIQYTINNNQIGECENIKKKTDKCHKGLRDPKTPTQCETCKGKWIENDGFLRFTRGTVLKPFMSAWTKTKMSSERRLLTAADGETRNEQLARRLMSY